MLWAGGRNEFKYKITEMDMQVRGGGDPHRDKIGDDFQLRLPKILNMRLIVAPSADEELRT